MKRPFVLVAGLLLATWALARFTVPPPSPSQLSGTRAAIPTPDPCGPFQFEIKSFADLVQDQVDYHLANKSLSEKEVRDYIEGQRRSVQQNYGGDVFACGYRLETSGTIHMVYAPVNGGRIVPGTSGTTDTLSFYDSRDHLLANLINGCQYHAIGGGTGSNRPRVGKGIRDFHFVFSLARKQ